MGKSKKKITVGRKYPVWFGRWKRQCPRCHHIEDDGTLTQWFEVIDNFIDHELQLVISERYYPTNRGRAGVDIGYHKVVLLTY